MLRGAALHRRYLNGELPALLRQALDLSAGQVQTLAKRRVLRLEGLQPHLHVLGLLLGLLHDRLLLGDLPGPLLFLLGGGPGRGGLAGSRYGDRRRAGHHRRTILRLGRVTHGCRSGRCGGGDRGRRFRGRTALGGLSVQALELACLGSELVLQRLDQLLDVIEFRLGELKALCCPRELVLDLLEVVLERPDLLGLVGLPRPLQLLCGCLLVLLELLAGLLGLRVFAPIVALELLLELLELQPVLLDRGFELHDLLGLGRFRFRRLFGFRAPGRGVGSLPGENGSPPQEQDGSGQ